MAALKNHCFSKMQSSNSTVTQTHSFKHFTFAQYTTRPAAPNVSSHFFRCNTTPHHPLFFFNSTNYQQRKMVSMWVKTHGFPSEIFCLLQRGCFSERHYSACVGHTLVLSVFGTSSWHSYSQMFAQHLCVLPTLARVSVWWCVCVHLN